MAQEQLITLQVGTYAGYVGAHFWNLQDEAAGAAADDGGGWEGGGGAPGAPRDDDVDPGFLYCEHGRGEVGSLCRQRERGAPRHGAL